MNTTAKLVPHPSVAAAIEEQQTRMWRLRSLLDVLREAVGDDRKPDDTGAAVAALIEYADEIHMALDADIIARRAAELENEKRQEAEDRTKAVLGLDDGDRPPDDPTGTVQ